MTYQSQTSMNVDIQIRQLEESIVLLQDILTNTKDSSKRAIVQEIIKAKKKLKKKKKSGSQPIKYGFLMALPLIVLIVIMDILIHGPQYFTTYEGVVGNLTIVFLSSWLASGYFESINKFSQSILEDSIDKLEYRLYSKAPDME